MRVEEGIPTVVEGFLVRKREKNNLRLEKSEL